MSHTLTHPDSDQEIEVAADQVSMYVSQGWTARPGPESGVYGKAKVGDLKAEVDRRNAERDPEGESYIVPEEPGNRPQLLAALEADDAAETTEGM